MAIRLLAGPWMERLIQSIVGRPCVGLALNGNNVNEHAGDAKFAKRGLLDFYEQVITWIVHVHK